MFGGNTSQSRREGRVQNRSGNLEEEKLPKQDLVQIHGCLVEDEGQGPIHLIGQAECLDPCVIDERRRGKEFTKSETVNSSWCYWSTRSDTSSQGG